MLTRVRFDGPRPRNGSFDSPTSIFRLCSSDQDFSPAIVPQHAESRTLLSIQKAKISAATYETVTVSFTTGPNAMNYPCVTQV